MYETRNISYITSTISEFMKEKEVIAMINRRIELLTNKKFIPKRESPLKPEVTYMYLKPEVTHSKL